ncbi:MAG: hypothetical protein ACRDTF_13445 [Pseudonocardiaceae bacterium]
MELHSEIESYRWVLTFHTPEGQVTTVLVLRRQSAVWLTFDGAVKTTAVMTGPEAGQLIEAVAEASEAPR